MSRKEKRLTFRNQKPRFQLEGVLDRDLRCEKDRKTLKCLSKTPSEMGAQRKGGEKYLVSSFRTSFLLNN